MHKMLLWDFTGRLAGTKADAFVTLPQIRGCLVISWFLWLKIELKWLESKTLGGGKEKGNGPFLFRRNVVRSGSHLPGNSNLPVEDKHQRRHQSNASLPYWKQSHLFRLFPLYFWIKNILLKCAIMCLGSGGGGWMKKIFVKTVHHSYRSL